MKTTEKYFLIAAALFCVMGDASAGPDSTYVEFLWAPTPPDAVARQQTLGFVIDGNQHHQICIAARAYSAKNKPLRIDVIDAAGQLVSSQSHNDFEGPKRCYEADLDPRADAGDWTFNIYLGETLSATEKIEVAGSLEDASFYQPSSIPYVLGRPNYDPSIPPSDFIGRLVWTMRVNERGAVTDVAVEIAEGVGESMRHRAISAGYLSLFPPDPSRATEPLEYRRELNFRPD